MWTAEVDKTKEEYKYVDERSENGLVVSRLSKKSKGDDRNICLHRKTIIDVIESSDDGNGEESEDI